MSNFFWQISYKASLSRTRDTSVWSKSQRLDNTSGDVWRRIDFKANLGLLSVVNSKTFKNE